MWGQGSLNRQPGLPHPKHGDQTAPPRTQRLASEGQGWTSGTTERAFVQAADWPLKDKEGEAERKVVGLGEGRGV